MEVIDRDYNRAVLETCHAENISSSLDGWAWGQHAISFEAEAEERRDSVHVWLVVYAFN